MANERRQRGDEAESRSLRYLRDAGLRELARNVGFRFGELDLIMDDHGTVVFVEVRYRSRSDFGGAGASVDVRKRGRIARAASAWLASQPHLSRQPCRFDVVALDRKDDTVAENIEWIRNAFTLDDLT